tara:strand:- start:471 stop:827 length:357 start_codon:yes stop_codon:yes gene_type:complete
MYKSTVFDWNVFNCPYPRNISVYSAPETWLQFMNSKRASGIKLDTCEPFVTITSKIIKVYEHQTHKEIAIIETANNCYFLYGPPNKNMIYYLKKHDYILPEVWDGKEIYNAIKIAMEN